MKCLSLYSKESPILARKLIGSATLHNDILLFLPFPLLKNCSLFNDFHSGAYLFLLLTNFCYQAYSLKVRFYLLRFRLLNKTMEKYWPIAGAIALPHIGGIVAAFITRKEVKTWYETLKRPTWRPPNWVFAPMWTSLYTGMGYASYLVWKEGGFDGPTKMPLMIYGANLVLNWIWTPIFFGAHKKGFALVEIIALWGTIGLCTYSFYPISKTAAYIMLPYWAWVSLASVLTYCIWRDNKDKKE